jgi:alkaline phosphatase D
MDFCGRVVQTTPSASGLFSPGDVVFGRIDVSNHGTLAEYFIAPAAGCAKVPGELFAREKQEGKITADEAACLGVAGLTAYQAIRPYVEEGKGEKVFINGGGGGVGTMAIQIAKTLGCYVVVSCSGAKEELCKRLGADEVIDYTKGDLVERLKRMGKVFKLVADNAVTPKELYVAANEFLVDGGRFVQIGGGFNREILQITLGRVVWPRMLGGGKHAFEVFLLRNKREDSEQLMRWMVEGKMEVVVEEVFELERVKEAFEKLKGGRCYGKLVVRVGKV